MDSRRTPDLSVLGEGSPFSRKHNEPVARTSSSDGQLAVTDRSFAIPFKPWRRSQALEQSLTVSEILSERNSRSQQRRVLDDRETQRRRPLHVQDPPLFMHYTISEDLSGDRESVVARRLAALGARERSHAGFQQQGEMEYQSLLDVAGTKSSLSTAMKAETDLTLHVARPTSTLPEKHRPMRISTFTLLAPTPNSAFRRTVPVCTNTF